MIGDPDALETLSALVESILENAAVDQDAAVEAGMVLFAHVTGLVAQRRADPGTDVISRLLASEVDGERLTDEEVTFVGILLVLAGIDTTWSTLATAIHHLATHPEDQARLRAEPDLLVSACEEFLRAYAPVTVARQVVADTVLGGHALRDGEMVLLSFPSANRDEDVFDRPDEVILDRPNNRHLAFGSGIHRCLGLHFAAHGAARRSRGAAAARAAVRARPRQGSGLGARPGAPAQAGPDPVRSRVSELRVATPVEPVMSLAEVAGTPWTFAEELDRRAVETPDKVFLWFDDTPLTFAETRARVRSAANQLLALGVAPGDTVALLTVSCPEWVFTWLACAQIGAVSMPINVMFRGEFLRHQLADSEAKLMLVDAPFLPQVAEVLGELPGLETLVVRGALPDGAGAFTGLQIFDASFLADGDREAVHGGRPFAWNDPACLFYTSGTTGPSKGALLTQQYLCVAARVLAESYGYTADDVMYAAVPLFHLGGAYGVVVSSLVSGRTAVLDAAFSVSRWADRIREHGATIFLGVGPMVAMLMTTPADPHDADLPVRLVVAAPVPAAMQAAVEGALRLRRRAVLRADRGDPGRHVACGHRGLGRRAGLGRTVRPAARGAHPRRRRPGGGGRRGR